MASTRKGGARSWLLRTEEGDEEDGGERKEKEGEGKEELLVFGYSCKLFREDEKAVYIDQGKHLIPWMGQESHMIDRYDGRGYIHDLQQYEPIPGRDVWQEMSEEEQHMESVCDEERYAALKADPVDTDLYHEEEIKRLRAALADDGVYNQVGFSYDESVSVTSQQDQKTTDLGGGGSSNDEEAEEEFVPAKELNLPPTMEVPSSNKINAIVEKTALFVARQGTQMEIVIKAKQASNPQFGFLAFDHPLNPYYKHVVQAVKQGKYIPKPQTAAKGDENDDDDYDDSDGEGHYLHPSLLSVKKEKELNVPKLNYVRTGDDAYSLLVSRLKDQVQMDAQQQQQQQQQQILAASDESSKPLLILPNVPSSDYQPSILLPPPPPPPPFSLSSNPLPPGLEPVTLPKEQPQGSSLSPTEPNLLWPPPDLVPIIDKMASYVAKNGRHFESVVKSKSSDSRFEFLTVGHPYYPYYQFKCKAFEKESSRVGTANTLDDRELKTGGVVSFSIKMKDNGEKLKSSTLVGSDGEEGILSSLPLANKEAEAEETEQQKQLKAKLEEVRLAEQRIKDKLAAAARERLAQASREKQLQLERKRKAALFLTMLRKDKEDDDETIIGPRLPNAMEMTEMIIREDSPPLAALVACAADSKRIACEERHSPSLGSRLRRERRRRSRSNSPVSPRRSSRSERHKRRSRSTSREISSRRRHRRHRRRSRSRSSKRRSHDSRERKKTSTPPASYSKKRRSSKSPHRSRSRSRQRSSSSSRTKQSKNGRQKRSSSRSSLSDREEISSHSRSRSGSRRSKSVSRSETHKSSRHSKRKKS